MRRRPIRVELLARVEGEGGLCVRFRGEKLHEVSLDVFEPPRLFEAILRGRRYLEAPDITARICGICPIAYQLGASLAMEAALGIQVDGPLSDLRRLIYCGEWIESHSLHVHMLHAPDFLGYPDAIQMARDFPTEVQRGLRLKKIGNQLMTLLGGREVHPVNLRVGGFYKTPTKRELQAVRPELRWGLNAAEEVVRLVAGFRFPDFEQPYEFVALRRPQEYAIHQGRIVSSTGLEIDVSQWESEFREEHVERSTALHGFRRGGGAYLVGPLARYNLNYDCLSSRVKALAEEVGLSATCLNPFKSIIVRSLEVVTAFEEALRLVEAYEEPERPFVEGEVRAGRGCGITEAPRGLCYHRYDIDGDGVIRAAMISSPTAQNQPTIESDLAAFVPRFADLPDDQLQWQCEQAVRNYDPCISCSSHFLRLRVERG